MDNLENFGLGVDPEIAKEFAGLWVRVRKAGSEKQIIGLLKKAGSRSALFISSTQQAPYTVLYDVIEEISTYTGTLNLPDGIKVIKNGKIMGPAENKVKD